MNVGKALEKKTSKQLRKFAKLLVILYTGFLIYFLLFSDLYGRAGIRMEYAYNLELFKEIKRFWEYRELLGIRIVLMNLVGNIAIFVPFGFMVSMASKYKNMFSVIFYTFIFSLSIECIQLITKIGSFDVDDLLLNTIGGCVGCIIFSLCNMIRRKHVKKKAK